MATLSNPSIEIDPITGVKYRVTVTVNVELAPFDMALINAGKTLTLKSSVWGEDDWFTGGDDFLFSFTSQNITGSGFYSFSEIVPYTTIDEDNSFLNYSDEIYGTISLTTNIQLPFPFRNSFPLGSIDTPVIQDATY
jgi:hypothetical protein